MDISRLQALQKRLKDWSSYVHFEIQSTPLKRELDAQLQKYRLALENIWESHGFTETDIKQLRDLERQIEELLERSRVTVVREPI